VRSYWEGVWVINEAAFDVDGYTDGLGRNSGEALREPHQHVGSGAAFIARVVEVKKLPGGAMLLAVTRGGQCVVATVPGSSGHLRGQDCLIAGLVSGGDGSLPLVSAARACPVHEVDAKYRGRNPEPMPAALEKLLTRRPPPAPTEAGNSSPAKSLLNKARMYAQNNMKSKAIPILEEILKKHGDSDQAKEARELLQRLDPARYPPKK